MYVPHAVAVMSVGRSMQITQLNVLKVVTVSSGLACALIASSRCFFRTSRMSSSCDKSISSILTGDLLFEPFASAAVPSSRFCRLDEGPGVGDSRFLRRGGESGSVRSTCGEVRSTYPFDRRPGCARDDDIL